MRWHGGDSLTCRRRRPDPFRRGERPLSPSARVSRDCGVPAWHRDGDPNALRISPPSSAGKYLPRASSIPLILRACKGGRQSFALKDGRQVLRGTVSMLAQGSEFSESAADSRPVVERRVRPRRRSELPTRGVLFRIRPEIEETGDGHATLRKPGNDFGLPPDASMQKRKLGNWLNAFTS